MSEQLLEKEENTSKIKIENRFNSFEEVIADEVFRDFVKINFEQMMYDRNKRPEPKAGYRYKRDWYDRLFESGNLNYSYLLENIGPIWMKKSSLSSDPRRIIKLVCDRSFRQTLIHYNRNDKTK